MLIAPSLIGVPVAFLPVPLPHTDLLADALPAPTCSLAPVAQVATTRAKTAQAASTTPAVSFFDLILPPSIRLPESGSSVP